MSANDERRSSRDERQKTTSLTSGATTYESANGGDVENGANSGEGQSGGGGGGRSEVDGASHPLAVPEYPRNNASPSSEPLRSIRLAELTRRNDAEGLDDQDAIARAAMAPPGGNLTTGALAERPMQASPNGTRANNNEAIAVRRHLFRAAWKGFNRLTRGRKWIFVLKLLISFAQVVAGIVILALPSSLGDSYSIPETCDPEGMFVFLTLHVVRVALCLPIDFYLGLSPHHTPRARRAGAEGQLRREQNRTFGNLALDRRLSRLGDLLGFCHVVLFIVGNYVTWTSIECAHKPADSRPLWFTCIGMLSISYAIIVEVLLLVFLVIFFLPTFVAIMRALGLGHRIPQRRIHPETGKITQKVVDEKSKLVYFTPAEKVSDIDINSGEVHLGTDNDSRLELESKVPAMGASASIPDEALQARLPSSTRPSLELPPSRTTPEDSSSLRTKEEDDSVIGKAAGRKRLGLLLGWTRVVRERGGNGSRHDKLNKGQEKPSNPTPKLKYPLYALPAHRATCPICLCDFEEVDPSNSLTHAQPVQKKKKKKTSSSPRAAKATEIEANEENTSSDEEPEPLRLMSCGHAMHRSCVDQWLTTISGRCPVCQRPVDDEEDQQQQQTPATAPVGH